MTQDASHPPKKDMLFFGRQGVIKEHILWDSRKCIVSGWSAISYDPRVKGKSIGTRAILR